MRVSMASTSEIYLRRRRGPAGLQVANLVDETRSRRIREKTIMEPD